MFKKYSDSAIISGISQQDDKILNWLYDNYFQLVKKLVLNNSGSIEDVSDVFQDSIIVLYKHITEENLNLGTDLKGYFFGIAKKNWSAHIRKKQRTSRLTFDVVVEEDIDIINDPALERVVSRAFLKLKPDQQMVLNLFAEGNSYERIAERLGLKSEEYARRKKYLCKEAIIDIMKEDPEYQEYFTLNR